MAARALLALLAAAGVVSMPPADITNLAGLAFPTGLGPVPWMGDSAPDGWYMLGQGQGFQLEQITDWPNLAKLVGNRWGGDGVTTFAMPQAGQFSRGPDGSHALWAQIGEDAHVLSQAELPDYQLPVTDPTHVHAAGDSGQFLIGQINNGSIVNSFNVGYQENWATDTAAAATGISVSSGGAGSGHNTIPKTLVVNLIVKA